MQDLSPPPVSAETPPPPTHPAEVIDTGLASLLILARYMGVGATRAGLMHILANPAKPLTSNEILLAGKQIGFRCSEKQASLDRLITLPLPCIVPDNNGNYFVLARIEWAEEDDNFTALIHDPLTRRPETLSRSALQARWSGRALLFAARRSATSEPQKFGFSWFVPALAKYRWLFGEVLAASLAIQLLALVTPMFFQVVMDKVLVHRGFATLDVVAMGLLIVSLFEVFLTGLRTYLFTHTTNRVDIELGARLFKHLLALPLAYFQARRIGDSVARVRELENIRAFITGNALTVTLDLLFSVTFIAVMLYYSTNLTLIVLGSLPFYIGLSMLVTPMLRNSLNDKFSRGAENQSFLVESISGIQTVKSMSVEPQWTKTWNEQLAGYVAASFRSAVLANIGNCGVTLVGKIVTVATMFFGAKAVIDGKLTVGQLIAFNMLASHVATPVMRLAQLWTDFQQIGISVERLGDLLNTRAEIASTRAPLPPLTGAIVLENIIFRYLPNRPPVLHAINLEIEAGEFIGVVGRSGSGKSTLTKLIQRLYVPESGRVLIDGHDIATVDGATLRRQIGVVLQENVLFSRSVRENIALVDPGAPLERVIWAARLAGAHEFISELPEGYDTVVGEQGANLSGGQRQRIAIARALMNDPRILIFDEATSALDYESESIIRANMKMICRNRTVIVIAHRLAAVRNADRIIVIDRGNIVEQGPHDALLAQQDGYYKNLFRLQQG